MTDIAASVLARLKNKSTESGRSYQLCLQLFCQEEFLRRLEKSNYAENLVLKGGLFLYSLTDFDSRVTVDIDFLLRQIPTQLDDFTAPTVNTYSIETTIAEKIDAILSLMEFSSRMKDYYDIYYLANKFDFEGNILSESLKKTFVNREHCFSLEQFNQVMGFDNDTAMQKKWKSFVRKIDTKTDDYSIVLKTIKIFLTKPFTAAVEGKGFTEQWSAAENQWKKEA